MAKKHKLLLIGPLPIQDDVVGGAKVSFSLLLDSFRERDEFELDVFNSSRPFAQASRWGRLVLNARLLMRLMYTISRTRSDLVMFNASTGMVFNTGILVAIVSRIRRMRLAVRLFGGNFGSVYKSAGPLRRFLAYVALRNTDLLLLQTQEMVSQFSWHRNVEWLPTTRDFQRKSAASSCRRFLMLAQVRKEKGIYQAIEAARLLPNDCTLAVFGSVVEGFDMSELVTAKNVEFGGRVEPDRIPAMIGDYDALILPTFYDGEGLPGCIIEAMQTGLPVIASRWKAIPSLVCHERNGLLVEPGCSRSLSNAMLRLVEDAGLYQKLSEGAAQTGNQYRSDLWHEKIAAWIRGLKGAHTRSRQTSNQIELP